MGYVTIVAGNKGELVNMKLFIRFLTGIITPAILIFCVGFFKVGVVLSALVGILSGLLVLLAFEPYIYKFFDYLIED